MIDALNRMTTQTTALLLIVLGALFAAGAVVTAVYVSEHEGVWTALFGLASNCVGGALIMLRAAGKEVNLTNQAGSNVGDQNVNADPK